MRISGVTLKYSERRALMLFHATNLGPRDNSSNDREVGAAAEMAMLLKIDVSHYRGFRCWRRLADQKIVRTQNPFSL
jgi:hypothetical protein